MKAIKLIFGLLAVMFLMAPLLTILPLAFTSSDLLSYPVRSFSLRWFEELMVSDAWRMAISNSLIIGAGATVLATLLGTLVSLGLRQSFAFSGLMKSVLLLPMVVPAVILGVGMQIIFIRFGLVNTHLGVIFAHTVVALPFVIVSVSGSLAGIDPRVERAAMSLGANPVLVFRHVTLPLALPGILSGAVLAFATSLDEVVLTLFVAGPNQRTLARQMFSSIRENISPAIASAAFIIIVGTVAVAALALLVRGAAARRQGSNGIAA